MHAIFATAAARACATAASTVRGVCDAVLVALAGKSTLTLVLCVECVCAGRCTFKVCGDLLCVECV